MNPGLFRGARIVCALLSAVAPVCAQNLRVDLQNTYERVIAVISWTGSGSWADPKRPKYTPAAPNPGTRTGILGYKCMATDDGKLAICEFVARHRSDLAPILNDTTVKSFLKGRDRIEDAISVLKTYKKDFDISQLGVRVP